MAMWATKNKLTVLKNIVCVLIKTWKTVEAVKFLVVKQPNIQKAFLCLRYLLVFHCACPSFLSFGPCSISDQKDPKERMVQVVKWYLSAFHAGRKGSVAKKPYNPILGEIFRCHWVLPGTEGEDDMVSFLWYVFWCLECMHVIPKASLIYCLKWPMLCLSHKLTNYSNFLTDSTPSSFSLGRGLKYLV